MILFIQNKLLHYRRPFYNELGKHREVVVLHSGMPNREPEDRYREIVVPATKLGPFWLQSRIDETLSTLPIEAVVAMFDIRWLSSIAAMYRWDRKIPWIWWGLDEGRSQLALKAKLWIARRNNPIVFYNSHVLQKFAKLGLPREKLFLGNNTFHVPERLPFYSHQIKNKFINVGTLDARKQNTVSILAFKNVLEKSGLDLQFILIGDGEDRNKLEHLIKVEGLTGKVILTGSINKPEDLQAYYREAIASISYGQAGLTVLQSMAFGVPFVTTENAISGGEKYNIQSGLNGLLCADNIDSLESSMLDLACNLDFARSLGENAYNYYSEHCTIEQMANGFLMALEYHK